MGEGQGSTLRKEDRDLVFQNVVRCEETKVLNNLSDREFLVGICGESGENYPFVLIPFVAGEAKKLEEDFPQYHVMGGNARFFQDLTTTLNVPQRFHFVAEGAVRGILFTPLVKEGSTGKL